MLLQHCPRAVLQLPSQEAAACVNECNGWRSVRGCLYKADVCRCSFPSLQVPPLNSDILIGFWVIHLCAICIRIIHAVSNITANRFHEVPSSSRKAATNPDSSTEETLQEYNHCFHTVSHLEEESIVISCDEEHLGCASSPQHSVALGRVHSP